MSILSNLLGWDQGDEMARATTRPADQQKIDAWVSRLRLAARDNAVFGTLFSELETDATLQASEVVAIAHKFSGGSKPKSRKAAITAIAQERQRQAHAKAKGESAAKARVW